MSEIELTLTLRRSGGECRATSASQVASFPTFASPLRESAASTAPNAHSRTCTTASGCGPELRREWRQRRRATLVVRRLEELGHLAPSTTPASTRIARQPLSP